MKDLTNLAALETFQKDKTDQAEKCLVELLAFYEDILKRAKREGKLGLMKSASENFKKTAFALSTLKSKRQVTRLSELDALWEAEDLRKTEDAKKRAEGRKWQAKTKTQSPESAG